ncbi:hypothetical protein BHYA_0102g00220 [Botrytis hyacinthi]|uniref:Uncharacterized protein n=1 Tax=Botrytis hyacinthi TaxID=278943 RepID=A0A4Z1GJY7_9HELO|nr:hypothetical protein BHYA_0102g00220 [Botrytis hyacinthi]
MFNVDKQDVTPHRLFFQPATYHLVIATTNINAPTKRAFKSKLLTVSAESAAAAQLNGAEQA